MTVVARLLGCSVTLYFIHFEEEAETDISCRHSVSQNDIYSCCVVEFLQILVQFLKASNHMNRDVMTFFCKVASVTSNPLI
jgi:hypothetical protein